jgi:hypothetical protein
MNFITSKLMGSLGNYLFQIDVSYSKQTKVFISSIFTHIFKRRDKRYIQHL